MQHILLKKLNLRPRVTHKLTNANLVSGLVNDPILAMDLETTGLDVFTDNIILISWASQSGVYCVDLRKLDSSNLKRLQLWMSQKKVFFYNSSFDHSFLKYWLKDQAPTLVGDSMIMYKLLANEGYAGQRWTLAKAVEHVLGWPDSHKDDLNNMIAEHRITPSTMWKLADLEPDRFFDYCGSDSEAAWQLMTNLRKFCKYKGFDSVIAVHDNEYTNLIKLTVEQYLQGILIDQDKLRDYTNALAEQASGKLAEFYALPEVAAFIQEFNQETRVLNLIETKERTVYAKKKDEPWDYPEIWTAISIDKLSREPKKWESQLQYAYYKTEAYNKVKIKKFPGRVFNPNSKDHLRKLFFEHLKFNSVGETASGLPSVDKKALPKLGPAGQLLTEYNRITKLQGYVNRIWDKIQRDGRLHVQLRIHGTCTGRSSGAGGLNIQQMPKVEQFLKCFIADPGTTLIDTDFTALENVVLAEFSGDKGLREIYASGKPHDSYLWLAYHLFEDIKEELDAVYNMENPTVETVNAAKKQFKMPYRNVAKTIFLASNYNAGAYKIWLTLCDAGLKYEYEEVKEFKQLYNKAFAGVKAFEKQLLMECEARGGWILNGLGRPLCIPDDYKKDIVNRFCQSTGVGLLHKLLLYINIKRKELNLEDVMVPWIDDWHDETSWQITKGNEAKVKQIFSDGYKWLNDTLKPKIKLKGDIDLGGDLWEFKK